MPWMIAIAKHNSQQRARAVLEKHAENMKRRPAKGSRHTRVLLPYDAGEDEGSHGALYQQGPVLSRALFLRQARVRLVQQARHRARPQFLFPQAYS